jgi:hypothetical protein
MLVWMWKAPSASSIEEFAVGIKDLGKGAASSRSVRGGRVLGILVQGKGAE